jgi:hypothetical protein
LLKIPSPEVVWKIAAIGFGLIVSIAVIFIMQFINFFLYPVPEDFQLNISEEYSAFIFKNPVFLIGNLFSSAFGSFVGGATAILVRHDVQPKDTIFIGLILMILGFINIGMVIHPIWFWIASTLIYIPSGWIGAHFIQQRLTS